MRLKEDFWLLTRPVAHRGLWGNVPENSIAAYEQAAQKGYPIEIDLYCTSDGEILSFHDADLERMTGVKGKIYEKSYEELKTLKLNGTDYTIPSFEDVLSIAENRSPLLIELKNQPTGDYVEKVVKRLLSYKGEFAIQSFNPLYIKRVKELAPQFIRGILGCKESGEKKFINRFVVKNLSLNFLIKPDFISYCKDDLPLPKRKRKNIPVLAWTVTNEAEYEKVKPYCNNIIFENFIPNK